MVLYTQKRQAKGFLFKAPVVIRRIEGAVFFFLRGRLLPAIEFALAVGSGGAACAATATRVATGRAG